MQTDFGILADFEHRGIGKQAEFVRVITIRNFDARGGGDRLIEVIGAGDAELIESAFFEFQRHGGLTGCGVGCGILFGFLDLG